MIVDLLGILLDGTDFAPGVPRNAARELRVPLGATATIRLRVVHPSGVAAALTGGALVLTARRRLVWPAQYNAAAQAARLAATCPCGGVGCRGCSAPVYGAEGGAVETLPAASLTLAGTLTPAEGPGSATFTLTPTLTRPLDVGRYVYDVWFTASGGARDQVVPASPLVLEPPATLPP